MKTKERKVRFFLYTKDDEKNREEFHIDSLGTSKFNPKIPTRILTFGWLSESRHPKITKFYKALFQNGLNQSYNLITVDWGVYAHTYNYYTARVNTPKAGKKLGAFLNKLHEHTNFSYNDVHMYGHSLGAHVNGIAAKHLKRGTINTIVGLDPALPLFDPDDTKNRLTSKDALYVETIHTNDILGFSIPIGMASFFPNGGTTQPFCDFDPTGSCSHSLAVDYFVEALSKGRDNDFFTVKCKDLQSLLNKNCQFDESIRLGSPDNFHKARGIYYLKTRKKAPFAAGNIYNK